jgi:DNA-binding MarR family transcriptional regulator
MATKKRQQTQTSDLEHQFTVISRFIDEFYNRTFFSNSPQLESELSPSAIKFLFSFVDENLAYPIGELGKKARVKKSSMTDIVDRMERDGLAERVRDSKDRRVVKVQLTNTGKSKRKQFVKRRQSDLKALFSQLEPNETNQFVFHLEEAYKILKKIKKTD